MLHAGGIPIVWRKYNRPDLRPWTVELESDGKTSVTGALGADDFAGLLNAGFGIDQKEALPGLRAYFHREEAAVSIDHKREGVLP